MITTLTGSNNFMLQSELSRRISEFVKTNSDMALERLDCEDAEYETITGSLQSLPFLSPEKLVILRHPGVHKRFADELENLIKTIPDTTLVIIVEPKPDKRSIYYKNLKKLTDFHEFNVLDGNSLANWLVSEAESRKGSISPRGARYLVERVGDNQQLLSNELDKLLTYDPKISQENIDLLTEQAPQGNIFQMLDAAFAGNTKRALELYESQRAQKVEPVIIVGMLARQLHILALVKTAGERSTSEIAQEAGLNPYALQKTLGIAKRMTLSQIKKLVADLLELDIKTKSTSIDADEALKLYILNIA